MSRNGSMKESILSIYFKERPQIIEDVLGFKVANLALEQKIGSRHADLKGTDDKRRLQVLFEVQLTPANTSYLKRIKEMISTSQEGVIVWIALSFDETIISDLKLWLKENQPQFVDFYALCINEQALSVLQKLNDMYKLEIYNHYYLLDEVTQLLSIQLERKNIPSTHCGHQNVLPIPLDFERVEDVKRGLLLYLRKRIPYFLNLHYDKKMNQFDYILTTGGGKYGVSYRCTAKDRRGRAFVELYFDKCQKSAFEAFKLQSEWLQSVIHPNVTFDKRRISIYFKPAGELDKTFEMIADILKKMVDTFSPYFYGDKQIEIIDTCTSVKLPKNHQKYLFASMPIELPELEYATEDSYRIWLEEMGELCRS